MPCHSWLPTPPGCPRRDHDPRQPAIRPCSGAIADSQPGHRRAGYFVAVVYQSLKEWVLKSFSCLLMAMFRTAWNM